MNTDPDFSDVYRLLSKPETPSGLSRRRFLAGALVAGAASVARPAFAAASPLAGVGSPLSSGLLPPGVAPSTGTILVLVQLGGGNDGLNTVVPVADPAYQRLRSHLALPSSSLLPIGNGMAFHPSLAGLAKRYAKGQVAVVRGVDYPANDLSHFSSMATWMSGLLGSARTTGWVGRWLDQEASSNPLTAVAIGSSCPLHLLGSRARAVTLPPTLNSAFGTSGYAPNAMDNNGPEVPSLYQAAQQFGTGSTGLGPLGDLLGQTVAGTVADANTLTPIYNQFDSGQSLTGQMGLAAALLNANLGIRVVNCATGGFDTHTDEIGNQATMLADFDSGVTAFYNVLSPAIASRVVIMTFSEFGRRPVPNSSGGTDHGKASSLFMIGNKVTGGLTTPAPSLTNLDSTGNLVMTTDYRSVYASVIDTWLGGDSSSVLQTTMPKVPLFAS